MTARSLSAGLVLLAGFAVVPAAGPELSLSDPRTGRTVAVAAGEPLLHLVFFATWCPACVAELPRLAEVRERWSGQGYRQVIVAVQARQSAERLAAFFNGDQPAGELVFDAGGAAEKAWSATRVPMHVLLDAAGRELARSAALDDAIESAIHKALAPQPSRGKRSGP